MSNQQTDQPDYLSSGTVRPSMSALLEIPTARMMVVRLPLDDTGRKYENYTYSRREQYRPAVQVAEGWNSRGLIVNVR